MSERFIYVTYIRTTPEKLWDALTTPEFTKDYWFGMSFTSDWRKGSSWKLTFPDGRVADGGEVVEVDRPRRLILSWRNEWNDAMKAEGYTRATFEIEALGKTVKLTVTHEIDRDGSKFIEGISVGWPKILASLKSLLETGTSLERPDP